MAKSLKKKPRRSEKRVEKAKAIDDQGAVAGERAPTDLDRTIDVAIEGIDEGLGALRRRIHELSTQDELEREDSSHLAWLTKHVSQIMGDVRRRQEQEQKRFNKLTPGQVLAWLRGLDEDARSSFLAEANRIDQQGSVLG